MSVDLVANVVIAGVLTGLVYGLMALGLSVIFGVVRVVNFAHGEMMTVAMYAATLLFGALKLDPFLAMLPVAAAFFVLGYALQKGLINPFITRPEHSQFMLLVALAIILVNGMLLVFGPDARNVQVDYQLESFELGRILVDKARLYAAGAGVVKGARFVFFLQKNSHWKSHQGLRRQSPRREGGRPGREAPLRPHLRPGLRLPRGRGLRDGGAGRRHAGARALLHPARLRHRDRRRPGLDGRGPGRRRADRRLRGARRAIHRAFCQEHVQLWTFDSCLALPPSRFPREKAMNSASAALAVLAVLLMIFPWLAGPYALSVATLILYFAFTGQAWNVMMGFAGQLSLGHSIYVGVAAYAAGAMFYRWGIGPWAGLWVAIALCVALGLAIGFLAFRFGISGVYFALLTIAFAEFTRIGFDHLDWLGGPGGMFLKVAQRDSIDLLNFRGPPMMYYYAMLVLAASAFIACFLLLKS